MRTEDYLLIILFAVLGYLMGSFLPAIHIARKFGGFDVRKVGSGNVGSTNVLRSMGWRYGLLNFGIDTLKGVISTALPLLVLQGPVAEYAAVAGGMAAVFGHAFPLFAHFKGGKCVATTLGTLLVLVPVPTLALLGLFVLIVAITHIISIGSITALVLGAILSLCLDSFTTAQTCAVVFCAAMVLFTHRANIQRLIKGEEKKIDFKKLKR